MFFILMIIVINDCEYVFTENDSQRWFQKKCPYGKAAEYTKDGGSAKCADINLKHAIEDISMSAFITILCSVLGAGAVASFCASAAYTFVASYRPSAKGLSYKVKKIITKVVVGSQDHILGILIKKLLNIHIHGIQNIIIKVRHARILHTVL